MYYIGYSHILYRIQYIVHIQVFKNRKQVHVWPYFTLALCIRYEFN